jgi:hypothetical protein
MVSESLNHTKQIIGENVNAATQKIKSIKFLHSKIKLGHIIQRH